MISPEKIIVALDFQNEREAMEILKKISDFPVWVKVGMELFFSCDKKLLFQIKEQGFQIFLDLKLHDIPHTVEKALKALLPLPFDMINIHAQGGKLMMSKAVNVIRQHSYQKKIIAVTHLTSTSQEILERELLLSGDISDHCLNLAKLALDSGCDGVVASALDALKIKKTCGNNFKIISPGIRLPSDNINDQARVSTPQDAINQGVDYLVIGRPITLSKDPKKTLQSIIGS